MNVFKRLAEKRDKAQKARMDDKAFYSKCVHELAGDTAVDIDTADHIVAGFTCSDGVVGDDDALIIERAEDLAIELGQRDIARKSDRDRFDRIIESQSIPPERLMADIIRVVVQRSVKATLDVDGNENGSGDSVRARDKINDYNKVTDEQVKQLRQKREQGRARLDAAAREIDESKKRHSAAQSLVGRFAWVAGGDPLDRPDNEAYLQQRYHAARERFNQVARKSNDPEEIADAKREKVEASKMARAAGVEVRPPKTEAERDAALKAAMAEAPSDNCITTIENGSVSYSEVT